MYRIHAVCILCSAIIDICIQAFESVVPSERTRISVTILNSSVRASAPNYSGALVPYIGELSFSTIIVGSSPEISFHLHLSALSLLLADDISADVEESEQTRAVHPGPDPPGVSFWQVCPKTI